MGFSFKLELFIAGLGVMDWEIARNLGPCFSEMD
jgi:hypothetical protein